MDWEPHMRLLIHSFIRSFIKVPSIHSHLQQTLTVGLPGSAVTTGQDKVGSRWASEGGGAGEGLPRPPGTWV